MELIDNTRTITLTSPSENSKVKKVLPGAFGNLVGDLGLLGDNNLISISRYKSKRNIVSMMAARAFQCYSFSS